MSAAVSKALSASATVVGRIADARRGYLAWLALETATLTGKGRSIPTQSLPDAAAGGHPAQNAAAAGDK